MLDKFDNVAGDLVELIKFGAIRSEAAGVGQLPHSLQLQLVGSFKGKVKVT